MAEVTASPTTSTLEHQVYLAVQRLASNLGQQGSDLFKSAGLSLAQFNVLRILRGAGEGRTCTEIAEQLISKDPDVTRLLDRLEHAGLVTRTRERADRRVVTNRITDAGLRLLAGLDAPITELHARQLGHLAPEQLEQLLALLKEANRPNT